MLKQELPIVISPIVISLTVENEECHNLLLLGVSYTGDIIRSRQQCHQEGIFCLTSWRLSSPWPSHLWHHPLSFSSQYFSFSEMMFVYLFVYLPSSYNVSILNSSCSYALFKPMSPVFRIVSYDGYSMARWWMY